MSARPEKSSGLEQNSLAEHCNVVLFAGEGSMRCVYEIADKGLEVSPPPPTTPPISGFPPFVARFEKNG
jgi:hypothetical protein